MYAAIPLSMKAVLSGARYQNLLAACSFAFISGSKAINDMKHQDLNDKDRLIVSVALPLFLGILTTHVVMHSSRCMYQYNVQVKQLLPPRRYQWMLNLNPKTLPILWSTFSFLPIPFTYGMVISDHLQTFENSFDKWLRAATCYDVALRLIKGETTDTWQGAWERLTNDFLKSVTDHDQKSVDDVWSDSAVWIRTLNLLQSRDDKSPYDEWTWKTLREQLYPEGYVLDWQKLFQKRMNYLLNLPTSLEDDKKIPYATHRMGYTRLFFLYDELWEEIQDTVPESDKTQSRFQKNVIKFTRQQDSLQTDNENVIALRKCVLKYQRFFHSDRTNQTQHTYDEINRLLNRMKTWCDQYLDPERST